MRFLRNTWYCAGWSHELGDQPKSIKLLNEPVVLYRKSNGSISALEDRCPHRFAPLSRGKVQNDDIACGYHGLVFNSDGKCVHNPQGDGTVPDACSVKSYPCEVLDGIIWVWMGDPTLADISTVSDVGEATSRSGMAKIYGYLKVNSPYEMVTDNLLDLGHVPYLHSFLSPGGDLPEDFKEVRKVELNGDQVASMYWKYNCPISALNKMLWDEAPETGTLRGHMYWRPPSILTFDSGFCESDGDPNEGVCLPQIHMISPETEHTCHYFWTAARNKKVENLELSQQLHSLISNAFENEDEPMVSACAENMDTTDLLSLKPVFLKGDLASFRARKKLQKLISKESDVS